eukprot:scaffold2779_cov114-Isochrysis_galbana.AAC.8
MARKRRVDRKRSGSELRRPCGGGEGLGKGQCRARLRARRDEDGLPHVGEDGLLVLRKGLVHSVQIGAHAADGRARDERGGDALIAQGEVQRQLRDVHARLRRAAPAGPVTRSPLVSALPRPCLVSGTQLEAKAWVHRVPFPVWD